ncbi:MAG: transcription termination factor NusA, partial [Actinomycetota bacterium]
GAKGSRVRMVMNELRGEKIDIIKWTEDPSEFVANALSPAKVKEVHLQDDGDTALVIVPDYQLSLAIGKEGQNARLAARLTGLRVDIKSESQVRQETEAAAPAPEAAAEEKPAEVPAGAGEGGGGDGEGSDD